MKSMNMKSLKVFVVLICVGVVLAKKRKKEIQVHGCSFQSDDGCTYNIQLSNVKAPTCRNANAQGLALMPSPSPSSVPLDMTQNDVATKVNSIEKNFEEVAVKHEVRLRELEHSVRDLVGFSKTNYDPTKAVADEGAKDPKKQDKPVSTPFEDKLMSKLTTEFEVLREEIQRKEAALLDTELKLNNTKRTLKDAQINLINKNQQLLNSENKISTLNREKMSLKSELEAKISIIETTNKRKTDRDTKVEDLEEIIMKLNRTRTKSDEDASHCRALLNGSSVRMDESKTKYAELKRRHDVVKHQLRIREIELINCYSSKTATHCGFEDNFNCGFTQTNDSSDAFDWSTAKGITPSKDTGPSKDHTCDAKTGHFMFIEASARAPGNNALLFSPLYRGMEAQCVGFYYHMYGDHIGTLQVYAKARGFQVTSKWRASGNQGDVWIVARLAIPRQLARAGYQIVFEGIAAKGYQGDIAIDDIMVEDGGCPVDSNAVPVTVEKNTDAIDEDDIFTKNLRRRRRKGKGKKNKNGRHHKKNATGNENGQ